MEVADRAAAYRDRSSDPFSFMLLALTHDFGKILTTEVSEKDGRIHSYGHETEGMPLVESFIKRITNDKKVIAYVKNMVPLHMKPNVAAYSRPAIKSTNRMFDRAVSPQDLIWFAAADRPRFAGSAEFTGNTAFLLERLKVYEDIMAKPHITGKDLIKAGLEPCESFTEILEYAHKLRLAGIDREAAMKQVLAYARKKGQDRTLQ
jgi:tRNA nucleotidyltransferase (CCA-adding enzyme)